MMNINTYVKQQSDKDTYNIVFMRECENSIDFG